jgi:hypothetical protein
MLTIVFTTGSYLVPNRANRIKYALLTVDFSKVNFDIILPGTLTFSAFLMFLTCYIFRQSHPPSFHRLNNNLLEVSKFFQENFYVYKIPTYVVARLMHITRYLFILPSKNTHII